jgi:hypothetical protein
MTIRPFSKVAASADRLLPIVSTVSLFFGMIMRHILRALSLVLSIFPAAAFAAQTASPCDLVDHEALAALKLDNPKMKVEHREIPASKDNPKQDVDSCTFTPRDTPLPALTVTTAMLPASANAIKPSCNWTWIPGMDIGTCSATAKNTLVTFAVTAKRGTDSAIKIVLPSQVERMVDRFAGSGPQSMRR